MEEAKDRGKLSKRTRDGTTDQEGEAGRAKQPRVVCGGAELEAASGQQAGILHREEAIQEQGVLDREGRSSAGSAGAADENEDEADEEEPPKLRKNTPQGRSPAATERRRVSEEVDEDEDDGPDPVSDEASRIRSTLMHLCDELGEDALAETTPKVLRRKLETKLKMAQGDLDVWKKLIIEWYQLADEMKSVLHKFLKDLDEETEVTPKGLRRKLEEMLELDEGELDGWKAEIDRWTLKFNEEVDPLSPMGSPKGKPASKADAHSGDTASADASCVPDESQKTIEETSGEKGEKKEAVEAKSVTIEVEHKEASEVVASSNNKHEVDAVSKKRSAPEGDARPASKGVEEGPEKKRSSIETTDKTETKDRSSPAVEVDKCAMEEKGKQEKGTRREKDGDADIKKSSEGGGHGGEKEDRGKEERTKEERRDSKELKDSTGDMNERDKNKSDKDKRKSKDSEKRRDSQNSDKEVRRDSKEGRRDSKEGRDKGREKDKDKNKDKDKEARLDSKEVRRDSKEGRRDSKEGRDKERKSSEPKEREKEKERSEKRTKEKDGAEKSKKETRDGGAHSLTPGEQSEPSSRPNDSGVSKKSRESEQGEGLGLVGRVVMSKSKLLERRASMSTKLAKDVSLLQVKTIQRESSEANEFRACPLQDLDELHSVVAKAQQETAARKVVEEEVAARRAREENAAAERRAKDERAQEKIREASKKPLPSFKDLQKKKGNTAPPALFNSHGGSARRDGGVLKKAALPPPPYPPESRPRATPPRAHGTIVIDDAKRTPRVGFSPKVEQRLIEEEEEDAKNPTPNTKSLQEYVGAQHVGDILTTWGVISQAQVFCSSPQCLCLCVCLCVVETHAEAGGVGLWASQSACLSLVM